ncbi:MAG TPA: DUF1178 family protein [Syntrophales bacterium]|nr:DUF1178 family protein [Syntrophales bacterium]HOL58908.1 DUF1178 family protein [Syntrophales bacterium]HPO35235.1 DUF1178 family protein [Syntrophales bacterium]
MIIFDLECERGHKFEGWFKDLAAFEEQEKSNLISCPICGSVNTRRLPSAVSIMKEKSRPKNEISPLKYLALIHDYIDRHFEDVGERFAEVALKIHYGEEEKRNIKGTTTPEEEETLKEEGVEFIKIPHVRFDS